MAYGNDSADLEDLHRPQRSWMEHEREVPDEEIGRCPNCGSQEGMTASALHTFDRSTGEATDEYWLTCIACGARTTERELNKGSI